MHGGDAKLQTSIAFVQNIHKYLLRYMLDVYMTLSEISFKAVEEVVSQELMHPSIVRIIVYQFHGLFSV